MPSLARATAKFTLAERVLKKIKNDFFNKRLNIKAQDVPSLARATAKFILAERVLKKSRMIFLIKGLISF